MLLPALFGEDLFDDLMNFDSPSIRGIDKKLYGKNAARMMKTDVREHDDCFEAQIDLPGFKKEQIQLELDSGYLSVKAEKGLDKDESDKKGTVIRRERYSGSMQRSFFVGDAITEQDIEAKFEDGVLTLKIPKKTAPEKTVKRIEIR
ncbi:MAG: Hsp20/alpha crystallin family protein [Oscillospiraceae bacterium]|nr:Hsp20/alpha crystallin family protein [Oscillospiraceae bacterium]